MKSIFVLCNDNFDVLLKSLVEADEIAYYFFSEIKLLDIAIKQKKPDVLLVKGDEFTGAISSCVCNNELNHKTPIIFFGKTSCIPSLPHFKVYNLPNAVNEAEVHKLFSKLKLIDDKSALVRDNALIGNKNNDLRDDRQLLNLLMDNLPDAIYFKDRKSRYTKINGAEAALLQLSDPNDAVGKSHKDFFSPALSQKTFKEEQDLMQSGISLINKFATIDTISGKKYVRATKAPLINADGKCIGLVGITRDITNEHLVEQELLAEKRLMDLLMSNMPDRIYFKDRKSRFFRCNMALAKDFGVSSPEELYGKTDFDFHDPLHAKEAFDDEQAIMENIAPMLNKHESYLKDGERFWLSTTKIPLIDERNEVIGLVGISRDYTKQKHLELKVEREKELLQILMDNIPDYIYFKDNNFKYVRVNKAVTKALNVEFEDIIGKSDLDFFSKEIAEEYRKQDLEVFKDEKQILNKVKKQRDSKGKPVWISSTKVPVKDENSKVTGLVGISRDATMEELTKRRFLKAKEKAEEANRAKSLFLANMSHEIRTPMNGIIGMADILCKSKLEPQQKEYLDIIIKSGQTLLTLINDILDFSKIESGKMELETVPINIRNIIEEVGDLQVVQATAKSIDILTYVDPKIPEFVGGDYVRLKQIITNLVNNAIKFTHSGEVIIHADYLGGDNGTHEIRFKVEDSGIGITKENQKKLFKSFSQVDASTTRKYGGTGLGLAISKRLVNQMGGKLELDSSIGKGSTFFFKINFAVSNEKKYNGMFLSKKELCKKHIVIVDDNETNRLIFRNYLETWNVKVTEFQNGFEALTYLEKRDRVDEPIDLMLLDYHMPGMNGEELATKIKHDKQMHDLKLVLLSSITDAIPIRRMNEAGFEMGLNKPIKMNQLLNVVLKALGMNQKQEILEKELDDNQYVEYKNKRFLIVEDNLVNIKVAQIVLSELSSHVQVAKNGLEAVDMFKTNKFDIILMDIRMPKMDGIEATLKIRKLEKVSDTQEPVKIIAMTANTFQEDIEHCMDNGMDAFLEKPFKRKDLTSILRRLL